ncbi:Universal stress protein A-like protein [Vitis vinifera]|uniref:Universal stress protein A-like protein n=1 Tax=Vitis vinifera TaxID=29760 RepID=A0A438ELD8_VITVI|nr:Universal stress protein A-like protein [Vitis vinifera]
MEMAVEGGGPQVHKKVMVAIDENECSYHALMWVLHNLKESIGNSPLVIFNAQPPPYRNNTFAASLGTARMYCPVSAGVDGDIKNMELSDLRIAIDKFQFFCVTAPEFINNVQEQNKKVSAALLEKAKSICSSQGVNAETISEVGDAQQAICDAVQKLNITLLILGDRGIGKIKRAFLGSVSNHCVNNAKCPVLVVKKSS